MEDNKGEVEIETEDEVEEPVQKFPTEKWKCPNCGAKITTHVPLNCPPICANPKKHTTKRIEMEKLK